MGTCGKLFKKEAKWNEICAPKIASKLTSQLIIFFGGVGGEGEGKFITALYRMRINYGRNLQNHIFTNTEQKYMIILHLHRALNKVT